MESFLAINNINITLYLFLLLIFLSFIVLCLCGDTEEKTYQKIIGGLAVFIVALISGDRWVFLVSMFIGGLIIASENFLKSLAAILKTDGTAMPDTLAALNKTELSYASEQEISEEKKKEVEGQYPVVLDAPVNVRTERLSIIQIQEIEEQVINMLSSKFKHNFTPNLKLENKYGQIVVDGVVHNSTDIGKLNLENALTLVEIKYLNKIDNLLFESSTRRVLERIRYLFITKQVLLIFCVKGLDLENAKRINSRLESIFSKDPERDDIVFGFVNLDDHLNPEVLLLGDLKPGVI